MNAEDKNPQSGRRALVIVTAVVGGIALVGAGGTAAAAAVSELTQASDEKTASVDGVDAIQLDADGSDVTVRFADVDEAMLSVTESRGTWTLETRGDEVVVRGPNRAFGWWFGNWWGDDEKAVLTLPESLGTVDADLSLSAGRLDVDGDFDELSLDVSAGSVIIEGSARTLSAHLSAGRADLELSDVDTAGLEIAAGEIVAQFTGTAPATTRIDASAGSASVTLPDEEYRIIQDVAGGTLDSSLDQSTDAAHTVEVTLGAGSVTLRPAR